MRLACALYHRRNHEVSRGYVPARQKAKTIMDCKHKFINLEKKCKYKYVFI